MTSSPWDALWVCLHSDSKTHSGPSSFTSKSVFFGWTVSEDTDQSVCKGPWGRLSTSGIGGGRQAGMEKGALGRWGSLPSRPCTRDKTPCTGSPRFQQNCSHCANKSVGGSHWATRGTGGILLPTRCGQPGGQVLHTPCGVWAHVSP